MGQRQRWHDRARRVSGTDRPQPESGRTGAVFGRCGCGKRKSTAAVRLRPSDRICVAGPRPGCVRHTQNGRAGRSAQMDTGAGIDAELLEPHGDTRVSGGRVQDGNQLRLRGSQLRRSCRGPSDSVRRRKRERAPRRLRAIRRSGHGSRARLASGRRWTAARPACGLYPPIPIALGRRFRSYADKVARVFHRHRRGCLHRHHRRRSLTGQNQTTQGDCQPSSHRAPPSISGTRGAGTALRMRGTD